MGRLLDDAFDVDPFILADLPFNAYYTAEDEEQVVVAPPIIFTGPRKDLRRASLKIDGELPGIRARGRMRARWRRASASFTIRIGLRADLRIRSEGLRAWPALEWGDQEPDRPPSTLWD